MNLGEQQFEAWLAAFGTAWQSKSPSAFAGLFSETALYYWTPFEAPKKGRAEIAAAFSQAVGRQRDIDFGARVLYVNGQLGAAHWSCALTRVASGKRVLIDGVLGAQFDASAKAVSYREWRHSNER